MARKKRENPIPKLNRRGRNWRIRWFANSKLYEFSLGDIDEENALAINTALAAAFTNRAEIPEEIQHQPAIKRYIADCNNIDPNTPETELIDAYFQHLKLKCKSSWPNSVKSHLKNANAFIGTLTCAKPRELITFLDHITTKNTSATRNRAFAALSGFYKWLRITGHMHKGLNPLENITLLKEERPHDGIITWEKNEVPALLHAANNRKDGIAVWIAILAGLRRNEIANLQWDDITEAYIIVGTSKTGIKRQVPLSKKLATRLGKEIKKDAKVVQWPLKFHGWDTAATRLIAEYLPRLLPKIHAKYPEKFGWNPFRHTFASRLAQSGLSLDIISAWMGDSPKVCKEHYARYVPKNHRDNRIDAVDFTL